MRALYLDGMSSNDQPDACRPNHVSLCVAEPNRDPITFFRLGRGRHLVCVLLTAFRISSDLPFEDRALRLRAVRRIARASGKFVQGRNKTIAEQVCTKHCGKHARFAWATQGRDVQPTSWD